MLTLRTVLGVGWSVSARLIGRLIDFVTLLVLARALSPADFGLTALAMTLIAVLDTVLEIPLTQALTRLRKIDKSHLDTAFTLGLLRGVFFFGLTLILAWPFSKFYHDPRLVWLIGALSLASISRGLYSPDMVKYVRDLRFREVFIVQVVGKVLASALALLVLYWGGGYWSIVTNTIVAAAGSTIVSYVFAPYRPAFSLSKLSDFSGFLGWFSCSQIVSALNWQFDRALLGHFMTKSDLGRYTMAGDLAALPTQSLIGPAMQPVMAAFANIDDDRERLKNAYLKASRFTMMLAVPASIMMALTADLIISIILNDKWKDAAGYLRWLSLTIVLSAYFQPLYSLALSRNKARYVFYLNFIDLLFRAALVPLGLYFYSVMGVIAARGVVAGVMFLASVYSARRLIGAPILAQLKNLWEIALACVAMAAAVLFLRRIPFWSEHHPLIEFLGIAAVGGLVYAGVLLALGVRVEGLMNMRRQTPP